MIDGAFRPVIQATPFFVSGLVCMSLLQSSSTCRESPLCNQFRAISRLTMIEHYQWLIGALRALTTMFPYRTGTASPRDESESDDIVLYLTTPFMTLRWHSGSRADERPTETMSSPYSLLPAPLVPLLFLSSSKLLSISSISCPLLYAEGSRAVARRRSRMISSGVCQNAMTKPRAVGGRRGTVRN